MLNDDIKVFGGAGAEVALTDEQKKILESSRKKEVKDVSPVSAAVAQNPDLGSLLALANLLQQGQQGGGSSASSLLSLVSPRKVIARKRSYIDKTDHDCFKCQGKGHWATDESCPLFKKRNDESK